MAGCAGFHSQHIELLRSNNTRYALRVADNCAEDFQTNTNPGLTSDFFTNRYLLRRSSCLALVACLFLISQIVAANVEDVRDLWKASALVGLAYGGTVGLLPPVIIEWFGLGTISLSPFYNSH